MASRASRLGWFTAILLGQQHEWASAQTSTCTSITVSGVGAPDGTYEYQSSNLGYTRPAGTVIYGVVKSLYGEAWWLAESTYTLGPFYRTTDPADHPADITLDWAECINQLQSSCGLEAAVFQPVITCEGDTIPPTPSPTPGASDDNDETPSPAVAEDDATPAPFTAAAGSSPAPTPVPVAAPAESAPPNATGTSTEEEPTPAPSAEKVITDSADVESQGEGGGLSTGSIVGIIVGILAVLLGGATLVIKFACQGVEFHCFNDCFNRM